MFRRALISCNFYLWLIKFRKIMSNTIIVNTFFYNRIIYYISKSRLILISKHIHIAIKRYLTFIVNFI